MRSSSALRAMGIGLSIGGVSASEAAPPPQLPAILWSEMTPKGDSRAFRTLRDYAACLVKRAPEQSAEFLAADYPSEQANGRAHTVIDAHLDCLETYAMRFTGDYLRGAMIETLYHHPPGSPVKLGSSSLGDAGLPPAVANCVVKKQRVLSKQLLETPIASIEQRRAFAKLDSVGECARAANAAKLPAQMLRFHIAEELYRDVAVDTAQSQVTQ